MIGLASGLAGGEGALLHGFGWQRWRWQEPERAGVCLLATQMQANPGLPTAPAPAPTPSSPHTPPAVISDPASPEAQKLEAAVTALLQGLAKSIAWDGEGATVLIECEVTGAADQAAANKVAKSIVGSSLAKSAIFGHDPNWGRIAAAAGCALLLGRGGGGVAGWAGGRLEPGARLRRFSSRQCRPRLLPPPNPAALPPSPRPLLAPQACLPT